MRLLTWNLAMMERSEDAPLQWGQADAEAVVRETILRLRPDVVCLQELPGVVPFVETHDMIRANPRSHSGNLAVLVTHQLMSTEPSFSTVTRTGIVVNFSHLALTVANVHLAPGKGGAEQRRHQLSVVLDAAENKDVVVIGDTNLRVDEEHAIASLGLTAELPPQPTWDGYRNRFRGDQGRFRAYFTRALATSGVTITSQEVIDDPTEVHDHYFHVSDHFPLLIDVSVD